MIAPHLQKRAEWWDNLSGLYQITSASKGSPLTPDALDSYHRAQWGKAWESADACETACLTWETCVQWSYLEDSCKMDDKMRMGQRYAPTTSERKTALMTTSGWLKERVSDWGCGPFS